MPTYEYSCEKCGITFELFQSMRDAPLKICTCGKKGRVKRLVGRGAGIIFKGSGFYETDYRRRPAKAAGGRSDSPAPAKSDGSSASAGGSGTASPVAAGAPARKQDRLSPQRKVRHDVTQDREQDR
jgi:putative FmdB family regulatory protein